MILKQTVTALALVMVASAMSAAGSTEVVAGGYGYDNSHSWSGNQNYKPKRRTGHRQVYAGNNRHLAWCYSRYRSYRLTDNTFQPYEGPRRECLSPYEQERRALFVGYPGEAPEILFRDQAGGSQVERDRFGYAPEGGPADPLSSGETAPSTDAFGNLPEQAAARDAGTPAADAPQAGGPRPQGSLS